MEEGLDLPENKLRDFIQHSNKEKWRCDNNHNIKYFTEEEIRAITNNYITKIGSGAFGDVYRGDLRDGQPVAVKRNIHANTKEEFAKEVITHSQINHKNVVRLLGCCIEGNAQMMVFEHVPKGNLSDHLHRPDTIISLETRLSIAIECAEALWCMHSMYRPVLHGDIKPSNILLDDNLHAKVSDFGLARLLSAGGNSDRTINVIGSIGYMDPTFIKEGCLSPKIDVYSFGVVLIELVTKTKPTDNRKNVVQRFARFSAKEKIVRELFDPDIANAGSMKVLEGIGRIAKECLKEKIDVRPEMKDVAGRLWELRTILEQAKEKAGRQFISGGSVHMIRNLGIFNRTPSSKELSGEIVQHINNITIFRYKELENITQNFSTLIGKGKNVKVYLGALQDNTRVAVRIPRPKRPGSRKEAVVAELIIHSQMQHRNIVKLVGCCWEMDFPVLVTEYAPNGSLDKYLLVKADGGKSAADQHDGKQFLDLNMRYQIAQGVASAMAYLHEERQEWVLHRDIKPGNILLDNHFCPMVCGFGLSKMQDKAKPHVSADILGTRGYMAPEWLNRPEHITAKADVYSFGMVLLEIVSGRRDYWYPQKSVNSKDSPLPEWTYKKLYVERHIITDSYSDDANAAIVERMVNTAMWCLQFRADTRPSMGEVSKMLEGTVEITEPPKPDGYKQSEYFK
ncbi:hypothetical protein EJB05_23015, partial [Eragrostis curvula]